MSKTLRTLKVVIPDGNSLNYKQVVGGADCVMHVLSRSFCISENLATFNDLQRPSLYILTNDKRKGYIGQTKGFANRVKDHLSRKHWWTRAYVFSSGSGRYDSANVEYLEYIAIRTAQASASYDLSENGQIPANPTLHEWDRPAFDEFFENIKFFLLSERCFIFEPVNESYSTAPETAPTVEEEQVIFQVHRKDSFAKGYPLLDGTKKFVVLEGSVFNADATPSFSSLKARERLLQHCVPLANGNYKLCEDTVFDTPSGASTICLGRKSNGYEDWKLDDGRTLYEYLKKEKH